MTKQKKVIWIILGIIIFVFSVFLGLGYLGQITGGNSLIQRTEMNDKYVPEEITKYYPIEDLNSKESLLSDKNYANSIQDGAADVFLDGQAASPRLLRYCTGLIQSSDFLILVSL